MWAQRWAVVLYHKPMFITYNLCACTENFVNSQEEEVKNKE